MEGYRSEDGESTQNSKQHASIITKREKGKNESRYKKTKSGGEKSHRIRGHTLGPSMGYICLVYRPQPLTKRGRRLLCIRSEGKGGLGIAPEKQTDTQTSSARPEKTHRQRGSHHGSWAAPKQMLEQLPCLRGLPWACMSCCEMRRFCVVAV